MATLTIDSPANGSSVPANMMFAVSVSWNAGIGSRMKKRKRGFANATRYTITCTGSPGFDTDAPSGTHSFQVMAGASGNMPVTATLVDNTTTMTLGTDVISVNIQAAGAGGGFGNPVHPIPVPGLKAKTRLPAKMYICGPLPPDTATIVCVTYQIAIDQKVPVDGKPGSPNFTVSKKFKKKPRQYSLYKRNLAIDVARTRWQATVKSDIVPEKKAFQIGLWFLKANGELIFSQSASVYVYAHDAPCV